MNSNSRQQTSLSLKQGIEETTTRAAAADMQMGRVAEQLYGTFGESVHTQRSTPREIQIEGSSPATEGTANQAHSSAGCSEKAA
jgi:hypothetical protein